MAVITAHRSGAQVDVGHLWDSIWVELELRSRRHSCQIGSDTESGGVLLGW